MAGRPGQNLAAEVGGLPPARHEIEVHLVGLGAGDRVVVRAVDEQPPRLVEHLTGIAGAEQRGERRGPLGVQDRRLRAPLRLLGVDVRHVLAGVDRVHVPGLRADRDAAPACVVAHGGEELARKPDHEPRPGVPRIPLPADRRTEAGRQVVIMADRQQDVAGGRHLTQRGELPVSLPDRRVQVAGPLDVPPGHVMVGQIAGQQPPAAGRHPFEFRRELHAGDVTGVPPGPDMVPGAACPHAGVQAGVRHQPGKRRVVAEHVQLPRGARVRAEHVALEGDARDRVADGGFGVGQVRVRLVVRPADDFDPVLPDEPLQVGPVLRVQVPVRLQVIHFGQHETVVLVLTGRRQVRAYQVERGALERHPLLLGQRQV